MNNYYTSKIIYKIHIATSYNKIQNNIHFNITIVQIVLNIYIKCKIEQCSILYIKQYTKDIS